jgi:hypothetical protein
LEISSPNPNAAKKKKHVFNVCYVPVRYFIFNTQSYRAVRAMTTDRPGGRTLALPLSEQVAYPVCPVSSSLKWGYQCLGCKSLRVGFFLFQSSWAHPILSCLLERNSPRCDEQVVFVSRPLLLCFPFYTGLKDA